jgi:hypothetical protein
MSAGTLLSDLDQSSGGGDSDLVQQILQDMNHPTGSSPQARPPPPPLPQQQPVYQQQMAGGTTAPITMDSRIPTAHIIGNEHPTPAEFASAIGGAPVIQNTVGMMPGVAQPYTAPSKNLYGRVLDEVKIPFVVALLFFVFSLPPIRVLCAHYMPSLIKQTGEFTTMGLLGTSAVVGIFFWILQRVIAPLLSF